MRRGSKKDYQRVKRDFWNKVQEVGKNLPFIRDAIALYRYMNDPEVPWHRKSVAVGALVYFIVPVDAIPDFAPVVGYLDDAGVISATVAYLQTELEPYYD